MDFGVEQCLNFRGGGRGIEPQLVWQPSSELFPYVIDGYITAQIILT